MELYYHPLFDRWFRQLLEDWEEVAGEVMALLTALEQHGPELGDPYSHEVVISTKGLRALRRTPPTDLTPYADGPPVLRVLYGIAAGTDQQIRAVVLFGGDKSELGNAWYPAAVAEAERRFTVLCSRASWRIVKFRARR